MDAKLLRNAGIAVAAAALLAALSIATLSGDPAPTASEAPPVAAPLPPAAEPERAEAPQPAATQADLVSFIVAFRGAGPLARAQALAAQGRETQARAVAQRGLAEQRDLRGLCFDRFTLGGAEIVLRSCNAVAASERASFSAGWLARLRDMPTVAYADLNSTAAPEAR
jgi:hypothetical protein